MPKPGPRPINGKAMTASERNRRTRRRQQIIRQAAENHDMQAATIILPKEFIRMLRMLEREDAMSTNHVDTMCFDAFYQWFDGQTEALKTKVGFDPKEHAFNPIELVLADAAEQIEREGL